MFADFQTAIECARAVFEDWSRLGRDFWLPITLELSLAEQEVLTRTRAQLERAQREYGAFGASVLQTRGVDPEGESYVEERRGDGVTVALVRVDPRRPATPGA